MGNSVIHHMVHLFQRLIRSGGTLPGVKTHVVHVLFSFLLLLLFSGFPLGLLDLLLDEKLLLFFSLFVLRTEAVPTRLTKQLLLEQPLLLLVLLLCILAFLICIRPPQSSNPALFLIHCELEFLFLENLLADVAPFLPFLISRSSLLLVDFGCVSVDVLLFEVQVGDS